MTAAARSARVIRARASAGSMPSGDREVVALARLAGYTVAEIAETLDMAPAEARSRMTSGIRALAQAVT